MAESNVADDDEEIWYEDAPTAVEKVEKYEEKQKNGVCTEERVIQETKKKFLLLAKSTSRSTAYSRVNTADETIGVSRVRARFRVYQDSRKEEGG